MKREKQIRNLFLIKILLQINFQYKIPKTGIITSINWEKIQNRLIRYDTEKDLWMEWYKTVGDWTAEGEILAIIYKYSREDKYYSRKQTSKFIDPEFINKNNIQIADYEANSEKNNNKDYYEKNFFYS